jgi:putative transposase
MLKAFKYRLYPTKKEAELINKHINSVRFVYNLALETKQTAYIGNKINITCFDLHKQIPELKKECEWLKEINSQSLQQAVTDLDSAYTRFFKGLSEFPKYKSKRNRKQSFRVPQHIYVDKINNKLIIPKFKGGISLIFHRNYEGEIKQCTISKTATNKYFVSILVDTNIVAPAKSKIDDTTSVGIDLGIKNFLTTSNGETIVNPKHIKRLLSKLKYAQSKYSKYKGKKSKQKLTLLHEKVANQRKDFLHKISTKLIRENQTICLEDLNIGGMVKNHNLAQAISDAGWGIFVDMIKYKAEWYGANVIRIGRFEPSSKTCSVCGYINKKLALKDREWTCAKCGAHHDRDTNAANNIKMFALNKLYAERILKNHKELPTLVGALTYGANN